jgi:hypothetical protein
MVRNYVYISKTKLDIYGPQLSTGASERTATVGVDLKVVKAELSERHSASDGDVFRLTDLVESLQRKSQIGTIARPLAFFRGVLTARSLIYESMAFFGGSEESDGVSTYVGLTCSLQNMIGYGYKDLPEYSTKDIGPTRSEHFVQNSSSLGFAQTLRSIWEVEQRFVAADFDAEAEYQRRRQEYQLTDGQAALVAKKAGLNRTILYVHPENVLSHIFRKLLMIPFFDPPMWLVFGRRRTYKKKIEALHRQVRLERYDADRELAKEELEVANAIRGVANNISAPPQRYEFVALKLLDTQVENARVVLGSPLYLAWV